MATENPLVIAKAICSKFKIVKKPTTSDIINSQIKMNEIIKMLPHFFSSIPKEINPKWETHKIISKQFSHRYLLVLGSICSVFGSHIYTKDILENDDIEPKQCLIIMSYSSEMIIIKYLSRYLLEMMKGLQKSNRKKKGNGILKRADREKEFYIPLYHILKSSPTTFAQFDKPKKRFKKGLHNIIINYKFEYQKNKLIPELGGKLKIKELRITNGKWLKHKLLWSKH